MNIITQSDMVALCEASNGSPHIRFIPVGDDDLFSVVGRGGVVSVDTGDLCIHEGYALLELGGDVKVWRVQKTSGGWLVGNDVVGFHCFVLTERQISNAWLGRATRAWSPLC